MGLAKKFQHREVEGKLSARWETLGIYQFDAHSGKEVYSIDTPPPTVSGNLHMGHVYSYSHADFMARFQRMVGKEVFYPMGFDDNGLPTELLVERALEKRAEDMGAEEFRARCLQAGDEGAAEYRALWRALGLSVDWRQTYRTIGAKAQRIAQWSFLDLYRKGRIYRQDAPVIWCPHCRTAIARAVRRYKSESGLSLGCELARLEVVDGGALRGAEEDLASITRAQVVAWVSSCGEELVRMETEHGLVLGIGREIG